MSHKTCRKSHPSHVEVFSLFCSVNTAVVIFKPLKSYLKLATPSCCFHKSCTDSFFIFIPIYFTAPRELRKCAKISQLPCDCTKASERLCSTRKTENGKGETSVLGAPAKAREDCEFISCCGGYRFMVFLFICIRNEWSNCCVFCTLSFTFFNSTYKRSFSEQSDHLLILAT